MLWQTSDIKEGAKIDINEVLAIRAEGLSMRDIGDKLERQAVQRSIGCCKKWQTSYLPPIDLTCLNWESPIFTNFITSLFGLALMPAFLIADKIVSLAAFK